MNSDHIDYLPERDVKPKALKPLPMSLRGISCCMCERSQACWQTEWDTADDDKAYLCSLCIMYETDWGRNLRAGIEAVVIQFQTNRTDRGIAPFETDASNRLVVCKNADDVLGTIVLSGRVAGIHNNIEGMKEKM